MKDLIIIGAGGHAKVIADMAIKNNIKIHGFLDDNASEILGYKVLGKISDANKYKNDFDFVIAVGSNEFREKFSNEHKLDYITLVHPSVQIGLDVKIGEGTVVMANAVINTSAKIGKHCIINTGVVVEHDNVLEDFVHISPNATLSGTVKVGKKTHIGSGAVIKNNISICENCIIGVGAAVIDNIAESGTYTGVPVRRIK